jgi:hypothetical protein
MIFDLATIHTVGKIAVLIILLLAVFLLTVESRIKPANRLFAIFLCLVAFDMCGLFMYDWLIQQPYVDMLRRSSAYLQMPLVYFYIKRVCFKNVDIEFAIFKHILLFVVYCLLAGVVIALCVVEQSAASAVFAKYSRTLVCGIFCDG